ncbi:MAG: dihydrodipicolinate synthase family protein [Ruminococcaceae bacterium]|nr:dihydrodipicolinate synthase family protein [Oscillospiraceae bacterium]
MAMLKGAFGVLLTPFTEDGHVDYNAFEQELDFVGKSDITGFFVCGTTGEFISLSPEQNKEMMAFAAKRLGGKKKLLAGVSDPNPATTIDYMREAERLGYDAAMVCPPYYFTMKQEDVVRYYKYLADQNICDLILYKIPMFTNTIELPSFEQLLQERRIEG